MSVDGNVQTEYASLSGRIHTLVIDKTLSISGAAADAKATGAAMEKLEDSVEEAKESVEDIRKEMAELAPESVGAQIAEHNEDEEAHADIRERIDSAGKGLDGVGALKASISTDLGDKWALANGTKVFGGDYPELAAMLPITADVTKTDPVASFTALYKRAAIIAPNTVISTCYNNNNTGECPVYVTDFSRNGEVKRVTYITVCRLDEGVSFATDGAGKCVFPYLQNYSTNKLSIAMADDVYGEWRILELATASMTPLGGAYHNGKWYAVFYEQSTTNGYNLHIWSTADEELLTSTWSKHVVPLPWTSSKGLQGLIYFNGYWCSLYVNTLLKTRDFVTWEYTNDTNIQKSSQGARAPAFVFENRLYTGGGSYTEDLITWHKEKTINGSYFLQYLTKANGWYLGIYNSALYAAKELDGTWTQISGVSPAPAAPLVWGDGDYFVSLDTSVKTYGRMFDVQLPTISLNSSAYTYIKVRE